MIGTASQILEMARSQLGFHEGRDPDGNWNNDTKYGRWYGMNFNPWCAMFVSWCAANSQATEIIPKFAYTPAGAQWFKERRRWYSSPKRGDIVFFDFIGRISHTGIVEAVQKDGSIITIEGNTNTSGSAQGDGVYRMVRRANIVGYGRPDYRIPKPAPTKALSFARLGKAATVRNHTSYPAGVRVVQRALRSEGVLKRAIPGRFGAATRKGYARWQHQLGYRGADANGIPGRVSLARLARKHGFRVTK